MIVMIFQIASRGISFVSTKQRKSRKIMEFFQNHHKKIVPDDVESLQKEIIVKLSQGSSIVKVDSLLCSRFKNLSLESALALLQTWELEKPNTLRQTIFFHSFVAMVRKGMWKYNDWNNLVETTHFVGHMNGDENSKPLMISLMHQVNDSISLQSSHYKDVCVVCESAFRASTAISMPHLTNRIFDILIDNTNDLVDDSVWLVMLIKLVILSKTLPEEEGVRVANALVASPNVSRLPFTAQCYVMSLFGNARLRHDKLFEILTKACGKILRESPDRVRIKDLSTVLWSLSSLAFPVDEEFIEDVILPYTKNQINERNLTEGLDILIQCAISLWMLGWCPLFLLDNIVTHRSLQVLKGKKNSYRDLSRFALLADILEAETVQTTNEQREVRRVLNSMKLLIPNLEKEVDKRPELKELRNRLQEAGFIGVHFEYPVKIFVAGVTGSMDGKKFHFDLADSSYCLMGTSQPSGALLAKAQLMKLLKPDMEYKIVSEQSLHNFGPNDWKRLQLPRQFDKSEDT